MRCSWMEPSRLRSTVKTFLVIRKLLHGLGNTSFCGDGDLARRAMCLGLRCRSYVVWKRLITYIDYYFLCGMLMSHSCIVVLTIAASRIWSTGSAI